MFEWRVISKFIVQNIDGYKLTLNSGSWREPLDIRQYIPKELKLSPLEIAKHMREGLRFAHENASLQLEQK